MKTIPCSFFVGIFVDLWCCIFTKKIA